MFLYRHLDITAPVATELLNATKVATLCAWDGASSKRLLGQAMEKRT